MGPDLQPTVVAAMGAAGGAVLVKILDILGRVRVAKPSIESALRDDLWDQNKVFEQRITACQAECDLWKGRYYEMLAQLAPTRGELRRYQDKFGPLEKSDGPPSGTRSRPAS